MTVKTYFLIEPEPDAQKNATSLQRPQRWVPAGIKRHNSSIQKIVWSFLEAWGASCIFIWTKL